MQRKEDIEGIEDVTGKSEVAAASEVWTENTPATIGEKCEVDGRKLQLGERKRKTKWMYVFGLFRSFRVGL